MASEKIHKLTVPAEAAGERLDRWLAQCFPETSRSALQKLIEQNNVLVEGRPAKPSRRLEAGEQVEVHFPPPRQPELLPQPIPLDILYQDEHLVVVNKPAGMVVHPGAGVQEGTLVNALLHRVGDLSPVGLPYRPGIVHRLDKGTSGILVVARTEKAHHALSRQFAQKKARRHYLALVWHPMREARGKIETLVSRSRRDRKLFTVADSGKQAITEFEVIKQFSFLTLLRLRLQTGRTHQIRIHLKYIHHPVFGDPQYGGRASQLSQLSSSQQRQLAVTLLRKMKRQALHAYRLEFQHPATEEWLAFEAPLPEDFQEILDILQHEESV